jgi:hypothetical protein
VRNLYQGVLQVGVGCHHAQRGNLAGAASLLRRGIARLEGLPDVCQCVQVARLRAVASAYLAAVEAGGPQPAAWPTVELTP